eukprot:TRINITY_DN4828_c0_g1_i1.p1 TRINITY_DN4828_c0_g1~~TRINITY_DN4828_c0_g1_i1.p1  ORF type:complete len:716 (-),score=198.63 TRINITY_DN4828_c0_g1_i1:139-2286(-)
MDSQRIFSPDFMDPDLLQSLSSPSECEESPDLPQLPLSATPPGNVERTEVYLLHRPRNLGGTWLRVNQYDKLRVTKGKGKRLKLEILLDQSRLSTKSSIASNLKITLIEMESNTRSDNSSDFTIESSKILDSKIEVDVKLLLVGRRLQFEISLPPSADPYETFTARTVEFGAHNGGLSMNSPAQEHSPPQQFSANKPPKQPQQQQHAAYQEQHQPQLQQQPLRYNDQQRPIQQQPGEHQRQPVQYQSAEALQIIQQQQQLIQQLQNQTNQQNQQYQQHQQYYQQRAAEYSKGQEMLYQQAAKNEPRFQVEQGDVAEELLRRHLLQMEHLQNQQQAAYNMQMGAQFANTPIMTSHTVSSPPSALSSPHADYLTHSPPPREFHQSNYNAEPSNKRRRPDEPGASPIMSPEPTLTLQESATTVVQGCLDVRGVVRAKAFMQFSDLRLKTNVTDVVDALEIVTQLQGKKYEWKQAGTELPAAGGRKVIGFIAQEVQRLVPEVVQQDPQTGYLSVSYAELLPLVIEAFKELNKDYIQNKQDVNTKLSDFDQKLQHLSLAIERAQNREGDAILNVLRSEAYLKLDAHQRAAAAAQRKSRKISLPNNIKRRRLKQTSFAFLFMISLALFVAGLTVMFPPHQEKEHSDDTDTEKEETTTGTTGTNEGGLDGRSATSLVLGVAFLLLGFIGMVSASVGLYCVSCIGWWKQEKVYLQGKDAPASP